MKHDVVKEQYRGMTNVILVVQVALVLLLASAPMGSGKELKLRALEYAAPGPNVYSADVVSIESGAVAIGDWPDGYYYVSCQHWGTPIQTTDTLWYRNTKSIGIFGGKVMLVNGIDANYGYNLIGAPFWDDMRGVENLPSVDYFFFEPTVYADAACTQPVGTVDGSYVVSRKLQLITAPVDGKNVYGYMLAEFTYGGGCASCAGGDCTAGNVSASTEGVQVKIQTGRGSAISGGSYIEFRDHSISSSTINPNRLYAVPVPGCEMVRSSTSGLSQLLSAEALANVVPVDASTLRVDLYRYADRGVKDGSGKYVPTGTAFKSVTIQRLAPLGGVERLQVDDSDGAETKTSLYTWDASTDAWSLTKDGITESLIAGVNGANERTVTRRVVNAEGVKESEQIDTYHLYPWGEELVKAEKLTSDQPGSERLTTTWDFYADSSQTGKYRRLWRTVGSDGAWAVFDYNSDGKVTKELRQLGNSSAPPAAPWSSWDATVEAANRVVVTEYPGTAVNGGAGKITRKETERLQGQTIRLRYVAQFGDTRWDIVCTDPSASWDAPGNLVTKTRTLVEAGKLRTKSVLNPDGTATFYSYSVVNGQETTVTEEGEPAFDGSGRVSGVINGTRTTVIRDTNGQEISTAVASLQSSGGSVTATPLWDRQRTGMGASGRTTELTYNDGSTEITGEAGCCEPASFKDRTGVTTIYGYDNTGRRTLESRGGIDMVTGYNQAGQVLSIVRRPTADPSNAVTLSTSKYDLAGRLLETTEPPPNEVTPQPATAQSARRRTLYVEAMESLGGQSYRTKTITNPDNGTRKEVYYQDGRLYQVSGTAAAPVRYVYGVQDVTIGGVVIRCSFTKEIKLDAAGNETLEWTTVYQDMAGHTVRTTKPREVAVGGVANTDSFFNDKGQLVKAVDPDGVTMLFAYNSQGEREVEAVDVNKNGTIDYAGLDRITKTTRSVTTRGTDVVGRTSVAVWQTDNADTPVASVEDVTPNGLKRWSMQFGLTTSSVTSHAAGNSLTVTTYPDDSTSETTSSFGRTTSQVRKTSTGEVVSSQSSGYDVHGRLETITDARAGTTSYTYYTDDRVRTITSPAPDAQSPRQTTSYAYHANGQKETEMLPDNAVVNYSYWPTGTLKRQWGARTYPVEYGYDPQGRLKTLTTWQDFAAGTGAATTTWNYDSATGRLVHKLYQNNKGPSYTYKPSGRLETRTWQRGVVTTYGYNDAGELRRVDYSDGTPFVELMRNRAGHPGTVTDAAGTRILQYTDTGRLDLESFTSGMFQGLNIDPHYDALSRRDSLAINWSGSQGAQSLTTGYGYDGVSRLKTVTRDNATATYTYEPQGGNLVQKIEISHNGQLVFRTDSPHDKLGRLQSISSTWIPTGKIVSGFTYTHNAANQRERVESSNGTHWRYGYDLLGQVTSGKHYWNSTDIEVTGQQYGYTFDDIGNRKAATVNGRVSSYTPNLLNQYDNRTVPGAVDVLGEAAADAAVTVNGERATRQGAYFHRAVNVANTTQAYSGEVSLVAVKNNAGPQGEDAVTQENRPAFVAQTPEHFTYDEDGNLKQDGRWEYTWDGENRLIEMESLTGLPASVRRLKLNFGYDWMNRRVQTQVWSWKAASSIYELQSQIAFVYDDWNLLAEYDQLNSSALIRSYTWGLDISGTELGAGGVGGLLSGRFHTASGAPLCFYMYDGNGNVTALNNLSDGSVLGVYEYGPFGEIIRATGLIARDNPFRFSTKYQDIETGLLYYGCRYYQPQLGRWLSRDPLEEGGGVNVGSFVFNDPVNFYDYLGLDPYAPINVSRAPFGWPQPPANIGGGGPWKFSPDNSNARGGTLRPVKCPPKQSSPTLTWSRPTYDPREGNPFGYWKYNNGLTGEQRITQRYTPWGDPITQEEAHPGLGPSGPSRIKGPGDPGRPGGIDGPEIGMPSPYIPVRPTVRAGAGLAAAALIVADILEIVNERNEMLRTEQLISAALAQCREQSASRKTGSCCGCCTVTVYWQWSVRGTDTFWRYFRGMERLAFRPPSGQRSISSATGRFNDGACSSADVPQALYDPYTTTVDNLRYAY